MRFGGGAVQSRGFKTVFHLRKKKRFRVTEFTFPEKPMASCWLSKRRTRCIQESFRFILATVPDNPKLPGRQYSQQAEKNCSSIEPTYRGEITEWCLGTARFLHKTLGEEYWSFFLLLEEKGQIPRNPSVQKGHKNRIDVTVSKWIENQLRF